MTCIACTTVNVTLQESIRMTSSVAEDKQTGVLPTTHTHAVENVQWLGVCTHNYSECLE